MDVSVVMPVKDTPANFLWKAVRSVDAQEGVDYELVIVDDGSQKTETVTAVDEIERRFDIVRVYRPGRVGLGPARNLANEVATAEFVAPLDSDDVMLDGRLEVQHRFLERHPNDLLVSGEMIHIGPDGREIERTSYQRSIREKRPEEKINCICHGASMYRLNPVQQIGGYDAIDRPGEDWRLWHRLWKTGDFKYQILNQFFIKRRVWGGNTSYGRSSMLRRLHKKWKAL